MDDGPMRGKLPGLLAPGRKLLYVFDHALVVLRSTS
jgi:hypothetical protein